MENASKALIIAGAILLAILIISLGIMIFNRAQDTAQGSGMSQQQITAFNAKYSKYIGDRVPGSSVRALLQEVIANNGDESNDTVESKMKITSDSGVGVSIDPTKADPAATAVENGAGFKSGSISSIKSNATYKITATYGSDGKITEMNIAKN